MITRRDTSDDTYRFICPAYVHGAMDGEKWPEGDGKAVKDIVFK